jgi:hypothetical protein
MSFGLDNGGLFDEAFERCGIDPSSVQHRHLVSARRSLNLLLSEIAVGDLAEEDYTQRMTVQVNAGQRTIILDPSTIDVLDAVVLQRPGIPLPMTRTSKADDLTLSNYKLTNTYPSLFYVSRTSEVDTALLQAPPSGWGTGSFGYGGWGGTSSPSSTTAPPDAPLMIIWPTPTMITTITYDRLRLPKKVMADLSASPDARWQWTEALCAGLAAKLAVKFATDRANMLKAEWLQQRHIARIETRERGPVVIGVAGFGRARRRRF